MLLHLLRSHLLFQLALADTDDEAEMDEMQEIVSCEVCKEIFDCEAALSRHMTSEHQQSEEEDDINSDDEVIDHDCEVWIYSECPRLVCPYCQKVYFSDSGYRQHVENVHDSDKDNLVKKIIWKCQYCRMTYVSHSGLKRHVQSQHPEQYQQLLLESKQMKVQHGRGIRAQVDTKELGDNKRNLKERNDSALPTTLKHTRITKQRLGKDAVCQDDMADEMIASESESDEENQITLLSTKEGHKVARIKRSHSFTAGMDCGLNILCHKCSSTFPTLTSLKDHLLAEHACDLTREGSHNLLRLPSHKALSRCKSGPLRSKSADSLRRRRSKSLTDMYVELAPLTAKQMLEYNYLEAVDDILTSREPSLSSLRIEKNKERSKVQISKVDQVSECKNDEKPKAPSKRKSRAKTKNEGPWDLEEGMIPCKFCGKGFKSKKHLVRHVNHHHNSNPDTSITGTSDCDLQNEKEAMDGKCPYCSNDYGTMAGLRYHVKKYHMERLQEFQ